METAPCPRSTAQACGNGWLEVASCLPRKPSAGLRCGISGLRLHAHRSLIGQPLPKVFGKRKVAKVIDSCSKKDQQHRLPVRGNALVVHQDAADLMYYRTVLQRAGCAVVTCKSYQQALGCIDAEHFDLIVLSQGSSAFEGRAVLEKAIKMDRGRQVLVVARVLNMGCYLEAMQLGARDYMEEPVLEPEMARAVETCLRSEERRVGKECRSRWSV